MAYSSAYLSWKCIITEQQQYYWSVFSFDNTWNNWWQDSVSVKGCQIQETVNRVATPILDNCFAIRLIPLHLVISHKGSIDGEGEVLWNFCYRQWWWVWHNGKLQQRMTNDKRQRAEIEEKLLKTNLRQMKRKMRTMNRLPVVSQDYNPRSANKTSGFIKVRCMCIVVLITIEIGIGRCYVAHAHLTPLCDEGAAFKMPLLCCSQIFGDLWEKIPVERIRSNVWQGSEITNFGITKPIKNWVLWLSALKPI